MNVIGLVLQAGMVAVAVTSAVTDLTRRKIPNWLSLPSMVAGWVLQGAGFGMGGILEPGLLSSLLGTLFCGTLFGVFWLWKRGFGLGDVKLLMALGSMAGFVQATTVAMCTALVGAVLALGCLFFTPRGLAALKSRLGINRDRTATRSDPLTVPYGVAIALGTIWAILIGYGWGWL